MAAVNRPLAESTCRSFSACAAPPGAVTVASMVASGTGANDALRASTSTDTGSPGSGESASVIATGSGAVAASHRAAWRQKNS